MIPLLEKVSALGAPEDFAPLRVRMAGGNAAETTAARNATPETERDRRHRPQQHTTHGASHEHPTPLTPLLGGGGHQQLHPVQRSASRPELNRASSRPELRRASSRPDLQRALSRHGMPRASSQQDVGNPQDKQGFLQRATSGWQSNEGSTHRGNHYNESVRQSQEDAHIAKVLSASAQMAVPSNTIMTARRRRKVEGGTLPPFIIHPFSMEYRIWLYLTCVAAAWTGVYVPFAISFLQVPGPYPYSDFNALWHFVSMVIFGVDMVISFRVAYIENDILVTEVLDIAKRYLKLRFIVDFMAWFPFDWILVATQGQHMTHKQERWLSLLQLLRLLRLYRVLVFFQFLELKVSISLLWVTLARNLSVMFYCNHWSACIFYFIARQQGFTDSTWVGANANLVLATDVKILRYFWSLYWSAVTFATVGYGDLHAFNVAEAIFCTLSIFTNIVINAWITGEAALPSWRLPNRAFMTIPFTYVECTNRWHILYCGSLTLLVIRHDERTGRYRSQSGVLEKYSNMNKIPEDLHAAMEAHLRLHFNNAESSDENVLNIYPTPLRKRILRFLYLKKLEECYLFKGCKPKLLDALLGSATVHLFMPRVEILSIGDHVNELYIVVGGMLETMKVDNNESLDEIALNMDSGSSMRGDTGGPNNHGARTLLFDGQCFGEVAFFTEIPQLEFVRTVSVCRVMAVPRAAYDSIKAAFPIGTRQMLKNLEDRAAEAVAEEFAGQLGERAGQVPHSQMPDNLQLAWATEEAVDHGEGPSAAGASKPPRSRSRQAPPSPFGGAQDGDAQQDGSQGSSGQGSRHDSGPPGLEPRDGRPLASWDPYNVPRSSRVMRMSRSQQQVLGSLLRVRTLVHQHTAKHDEDRMTHFLYAAARGDTELIQQMLQQGFAANASDYDGRQAQLLSEKLQPLHLPNQRHCLPNCRADELEPPARLLTALHLAACKGHLDVINLLAAAGASLSQQDMQGHTPLSEACACGHDAAIDLLLSRGAELGKTAAEQLCECIFEGDLKRMGRLMKAGADVNVGDYDKRRPLHIAAAEINLPATKMLVEQGKADLNVRDRWGQTPLEEAIKSNANKLVEYLRSKTSS
eukprot:jgi/Astpho2/6788/Aster-07232